ncbi:MAG TPA: iron-containing alcohol dehydrogenase [Gammaproteobacteria bacterium]|nr:iron-containing alcohol dehydrogenase [Gammaproteobacteria bacterium]
MNINAFDIAALPRIVFGPGRLQELADIVAAYGRSVLVLTGGKSFRETAHWSALQTGLKRAGVQFADMTVTDEPSPQMIDNAVRHHHGRGIEAVVAIGGGSVLDAGKAIAGLLPFGNSVLDHLEGVGRGIPYTGPALPFIAVPTTAGTGSEATKNAVLSERGEGGYKKSFRHDTLVPRVALVDPEMLASCPAPQIAANGMDALTQLLESYVSLKANPFTDALAWSGLVAIRDGFLDAWHGGDSEGASAGRAGMAYGALLSGITLAQVGLGSVHGLASPLGAFFPIPHGVVCGTLVAAATDVNIRVLKDRAPDSPALPKYAAVGRLFARDDNLDDDAARAALVERLADWTARMEIPHLGAYGVTETDVARVVADSRGSSMKTNPIVLTDEEVGEVVKKRL